MLTNASMITADTDRDAVILLGTTVPLTQPAHQVLSAILGRRPRCPAVMFTGEDHRAKTFDFTDLPLPGLHDDLAVAVARRVGPTGGLRTASGANGLWQAVRRFLYALAELPDPPQRIDDLRPRHLDRFRMERLQTCNAASAAATVRVVRRLLRELPNRLPAELEEWIWQRNYVVGAGHLGAGWVNDAEFATLMAAARSDVVAIRDRIDAGERLLAAFQLRPHTLTEAERARGQQLLDMALTGRPDFDRTGVPLGAWSPMLTGLASELFLVSADLAPMLVFMAGLTGRNSETIKELPADHRVLELGGGQGPGPATAGTGQLRQSTLTHRRWPSTCKECSTLRRTAFQPGFLTT